MIFRTTGSESITAFKRTTQFHFERRIGTTYLRETATSKKAAFSAIFLAIEVVLYGTVPKPLPPSTHPKNVPFAAQVD
ncbi:MAG: hypothetical protein WCQ91_07010 [Planctomycetota bacterium]